MSSFAKSRFKALITDVSLLNNNNYKVIFQPKGGFPVMEYKEVYEAVEIEVVEFESEDVITLSDPWETPIIGTNTES